MKIFRCFLDWILLVFIALLPLKFTMVTGIAALPSSYWGDLSSLIYSGWSPHLFALTSALLLILSASELFLRASFSEHSICEPVPDTFRTFLALWIALSAFCMTGMIQASCREAAVQMLDHFLALGCFAGTVYLALLRDKSIIGKMLTALTVGAILSAFAGLEQIVSGLRDLREYAASANIYGEINDKLKSQINSDRIIGTFPICNLYAGFLAAILPLLITNVWHWAGERVKPPLPAQILLAIFFACFLGIPLWLTGSRGAILALAAGLACTLFFLLQPGKERRCFCGAVLAAAVLIGLLIFMKRGTESIRFRIDYDLAAVKMLWHNLLTGTGLGDFFYEYPRWKQLINDETPRSPHNLPLFFGSQCGIAAFCTAIAVMVYPLIKGFRELLARKKEGTDRKLLFRFAAPLAALSVLSLDMLFEMGIESPASACTLILLAFAVLSESRTSNWKPAFRFTAVFPALLLFAFGIITGLLAQREVRKEYAFACFFEKANPYLSRTPDFIPHPDTVLQAYTEALALAPDSPFLRNVWAKYSERRHLFRDAEKSVSEAIDREPENTALYRWRMELMFRRHAALPEYGEDAETIFRLDPNNPHNKRYEKILQITEKENQL